jgi:orotate phosphoribosyltransferase
MSEESKATIAKAIFQSSAIQFGDFTLASGLKSPFYIDLSRLLTSPSNLEIFLNAAGMEIRSRCNSAKIDQLASIELRGALLLSALSSYIGLPCFVIRKREKDYGVPGKIVGGEIKSGAEFILFDDVVTDGQSKLDSIRTLEEAGAKVRGVLVVVDREQGGARNLQARGYALDSLLTVNELISHLRKSGHIGPQVARRVTDYIAHETENIQPLKG